MSEGGQICAQCGNANRHGARFCDGCGVPAAASPPLTAPPAPSEHRQLTVLFSDVVASMQQAERAGTEDWQALMDRFYAVSVEVMTAFGGHVHHFTGDGVMALFGAPQAQEDHARRACLAALALRDRVGSEFAFTVRIGLHSGDAVIGEIGGSIKRTFNAIGHTVGLAKRMEALAPSGSTAISAATAALVRDEFTLVDLGSFFVKGASAQLRALELRGPAAGGSPIERADQGGRLAPLVGRRSERAALDAALERALAGDGRVVGLVGEPGVGKSRLAHDFACACQERGITVHRAAALSHGRDIPLAPALELLRKVLGIDRGADPAAARAAIHATLGGPEASVAEGDLSVLFEFLGIAEPGAPASTIDPEARQRRLLALVGALTRARSAREPSVLLLEDLQWLDPASRVFLAELVTAVAGTRTLLLGTYRPEYERTALGREHVEELTLAPLSGDAVTRLLAGLLGAHPSLDGLAALVAARAGGNPFFCEELVQALAERGHLTGERGAFRLARSLKELVLPPTVQAALGSRIDRLGRREKALLHQASTVGEEMDRALLAELSGLPEPALAAALTQLTEAALLATAADGTIAFRHPLTREVAYRMQLTEQRQATHAATAEALQALHADGLDERAALIAHHLDAAGRVGEAAAWQARAAVWAERTNPVEGMRQWQAARRLADLLPPGPERGGLALGARVGILAQSWRVGLPLDELRRVHSEALALLGDPDDASVLRVLVGWGYAAALLEAGEVRECHGLTPAMEVRVRALEDPGLHVAFAAGLAFTLVVVGDLEAAMATCAEALDLAGGDPSVGAGIAMACPYAQVLMVRAYATGIGGDLEAALPLAEEALAVAERRDAYEHVIYNGWTMSALRSLAGDAAGALADARRVADLAETAGHALANVLAGVAAAWAHAAAGASAAAADAAQRTLTDMHEWRVGLNHEAQMVTVLSESALADGRVDEALTRARQAVELVERRGVGWTAIPARLALARALLACESAREREQARAELGEASAAAARTGIRIHDGEITRLLASAGAVSR